MRPLIDPRGVSQHRRDQVGDTRKELSRLLNLYDATQEQLRALQGRCDSLEERLAAQEARRGPGRPPKVKTEAA